MKLLPYTTRFMTGHLIFGCVVCILYFIFLWFKGDGGQSCIGVIFFFSLIAVTISTITIGVRFFFGICYNDLSVNKQVVFIAGVVAGVLSLLTVIVTQNTKEETGIPSSTINYLAWFATGVATPFAIKKIEF